MTPNPPQPSLDELRTALKRALRRVATLEGELARAERIEHEPIAVVGLGCRMPGGADDPELLWRLLREGRDAITEIPGDRPQLLAAAAERGAFRWGGFVDAFDRFDAEFFGISPREAAWMDPQQRLLLEVCWQAFEHAGLLPDALSGTRTGVFLGMVGSEGYLDATREASRSQPDVYTATGSTLSVAAGRISYTLGLHGPALVVDTACSSSLVALDLAVRSLRASESDLALAGGCSLMLSEHDARALTTGNALARDGRCRSFDARASGIVRAEGCGIVVLERLSDALANGHRVLALVRGAAINQDGRSAGLTAPNAWAQAQLLQSAFKRARITPDDLDYIETHGTGTDLGDPIELEALSEVLGTSDRNAPRCVLGALKTNLGHLEAAAGIAGFIKAVLALQHGLIPKNLHFEALNPRASLAGTRLMIPTENVAWPRRFDRPRRAGVSSFGMSGTNAHVVLEEAGEQARAPERAAAEGGALRHALLVSARSAEALREQALRYADFIARPDVKLEDACYTAALRRTHHAQRLAVVAEDRAQLSEGLRAFARDEDRPTLVTGTHHSFERPRLVFVFPGQGSQWLGMGRQLYQSEPVFRAAVEDCLSAAASCSDAPLREALLAASDASLLDQTWVLQPLLITIEIALAALWRARGVIPDVVVGASMGEVAAAHVAGVLSLQDAMAITCKRSALLCTLEGRGAMAMTELSFEEAERWIQPYAGKLEIASSNSPRSTVLTGEDEAMTALLAQLEQKQLFYRRVNAKGAGHSAQLDEILEPLGKVLGELAPAAGDIPIYSTVTGGLLPGSAFDCRYWLRNVRQTVRFNQACEALLEGGYRLFLEVSPHPILLPAIHQVAASRKRACSAIGTLHRKQAEAQAFACARASLHCHGYPIDWSELAAGAELVSLPAYPFRRERHWIVAPEHGHVRSAQPSDAHPLLGAAFQVAHPSACRYWECALDLARLPYLADHRIGRSVVLPAAAVIELAYAAAREQLGQSAIVIEDLTLHEALVLDELAAVRIQVVLEASAAETWSFRLFRSLQTADAAAEAWKLHASANVRAASASDLARSRAPLASAQASADAVQACARDVEAVYTSLAAIGGEYGPAFRGLTRAEAGPCVARVCASLPGHVSERGYGAHPALLDAAFQALAVADLPEALRTGQPCLPVAFERVVLHGPWPRDVTSAVSIDPTASSREALLAALQVHAADSGDVLASIEGLRLQALQSTSARDELAELMFESAWQAAADGPRELPSGRWLVLTDRGGVGAALAQQLSAAGVEVRCVAAPDCDFAGAQIYEHVDAILRDALAPAEPLRGIVHLWGLDDAPVAAHPPQSAWFTHIGLRGWSTALRLAQTLDTLRFRDAPRLVLVTRQAQAVAAGDPVAPEQALLWGLGGTLRSECSGLRVLRVDLAGPHDRDASAQLAQLLAATDDEDQVALRADRRYVARLRRARAIAPARSRDAAQPTASHGRDTPTFHAQRAPEIRRDGTYLVTGGMSGLGLSAASWLAERGAGHLLLLGRHIPDDADTQQRLAALEALGARVTLQTCDVSDREQLRAVLSANADDATPVRGVIHAAGALADGLLARQSFESFRHVLAAKVGGAWLLHTLTAGLPIELFVLYSSAASLMGSAGQANYVAANAFLDALAQHRHALGLPAKSINWGHFVDVGHVEGKQFRGLRGLHEHEGHRLLEAALSRPEAQLGAIALDVAELLDFYPHFARWPYLQALAGEERTRALGDPELLARLCTGDRTQNMRDYLRTELARVVRIDPSRIEGEAPLSRLGLDSLMGLELRRRLEAALGITLPATLVWTYPTLHAVADFLSERITPTATSAEESNVRESQLSELSDRQLWELTNSLVS